MSSYERWRGMIISIISENFLMLSNFNYQTRQSERCSCKIPFSELPEMSHSNVEQGSNYLDNYENLSEEIPPKQFYDNWLSLKSLRRLNLHYSTNISASLQHDGKRSGERI